MTELETVIAKADAEHGDRVRRRLDHIRAQLTGVRTDLNNAISQVNDLNEIRYRECVFDHKCPSKAQVEMAISFLRDADRAAAAAAALISPENP